MRTIAVMHAADTGGPPQHLLPWLRELAARGSLEVVVPGPGRVEHWYQPFARIRRLAYRPLEFPRTPAQLVGEPLRFAREYWLFRNHFRATRPDLVVVVTAVVPAALLGAASAGVPTVVYVGELFDRGYGERRVRHLALGALRGLTARKATGIVACSRAVAAQFGARRFVATIYPGVRPVELPARERARARFGLTAEPCLAVIGNLTEARGQDVLLRALSLIRAPYPGVQCILAGATSQRLPDLRYRGRLERLAAELRLGGQVQFVGFVEPVTDVYAAADIVVNPARFNEPFGRVALEALVAGRPVIVADVGAVREVLRDGVDALFVPPDDPAALAAAVLHLLRDAPLRGRLVEAGRSRLLREFPEARGGAEFSAFVDEVLAATRSPGRRR